MPLAGQTIGQVSRHLHLPPATIRTWERRYGLAPASRSGGGHRRYEMADVARLELLKLWLSIGITAGDAADLVLHPPPVEPGEWAKQVLNFTKGGDRPRFRNHVRVAIEQHGVLDAWSGYFRPLLQEISHQQGTERLQFAKSGAPIIRAELSRVAVQARPRRGPPVLLASTGLQPSLALVALSAALAVEGVAVRLADSPVTATSLQHEASWWKPAGILVSASPRRPPGGDLHRVLDRHSELTVTAGSGYGWFFLPGSKVQHFPEPVSAHPLLSRAR
ncbi:MerR family transcriptional regulator [Aeromicrobium sp. Root495]|uniref:MerR family transcriptional regulator n=1 Tax=Aeromicrobium sp. Root495 TaxID=1736550 RepID=UPI0009E94602